MSAKTSPDPRKTNGTSTTLVTTEQACKELGITTRYFRMLRKRLGTIEGQTMVDGAWVFPLEALKQWHARYDGAEEDEPETLEEGQAALMREVVNASKQVFATAQVAITAAVDAIKGTDHRTDSLIKELERMSNVAKDAHTMTIETVKLVRDLIVDQAKMEGESLVKAADQTVRVERTKVAAQGIRMFAPIVKTGLARVLGNASLAREAQSETVLEVIKSLKDDPKKLTELQQVLSEKQLEAVSSLLSFAEGHSNLGEALKVLKSEMTGERMTALSRILTDRQLTAIGSLFDEEDDEKSEPEPEKKSGTDGR